MSGFLTSEGRQTQPKPAAQGGGLRISRPGDPQELRAAEFEKTVVSNGPGPAPAGSGSTAQLPEGLQAHFGHQLKHRFDRVRVHHDAAADRAAERLSASAFTIGTDIYFRSGRYAPATRAGLGLIGHELEHVRQQSRTGPRLDRKIFTKEELEDESPPSTQPQIPLLGSDPAFEKFAAALAERYGVKIVRRGSFSEQATEVASARVNPGVQRGTLARSDWTDWSPPSGWATYRMILNGIESFAQGFGGLPAIREVVLYDVHYTVDEKTGVVRKDRGEGASFGAGQLRIYSAIIGGDPRPAGRSGPLPGQEAATVKPTSERAAVRRNIEHELGHAVADAARGPTKEGPDPSIFEDYRLAAGWTEYRRETSNSPAAPERLFDAGVAEVRDALRAGTDPPEKYHITPDNWNDGKWIEQPITRYSTTNPAEDLAEAIMAFLEFPEVLKARSPRRFAFIESRKAKWLPKQSPSPARVPPGGLAPINPLP